MPRVVMEYGPPGLKGVTQIMGIGADDIEPSTHENSMKTVGIGAAAIFALGIVAGNKNAQQFGLGAGAAILACHLLAKRLERKATGSGV